MLDKAVSRTAQRKLSDFFARVSCSTVLYPLYSIQIQLPVFSNSCLCFSYQSIRENTIQ